MSRTPGEIFADARQKYRLENGFHKSRCYGWDDLTDDERASEQAAANAVLEEAAKVLADIGWGGTEGASAVVRSLKSTSADLCQATDGAKGEEGGEAEEWGDCGFGICEDCGAGLIDDHPCLRCKWQERRQMGLSVWRPCDCHKHEQQVCDLCQGVAPRLRPANTQSQIEEPRRGDEVEAAHSGASLTHKTEEDQ